MYNNEVTYDDKWNTPENRKARDELERRYFNNSHCCPDCPLSWAVEVLEMMNTIDSELGFQYNDHTMRGYYVQGNPKEWFITSPWKALFSSVRRNIFGSPYTYKHVKGMAKHERVKKNVWERITSIKDDFVHPFSYGFRALRVKYINAHLNKWLKKRVTLSQLKEKYGELRVYFSAPDAFEEWVENEIRKCEIKLALKGAYYPIETFWDSGTSYSVGDEYRPDTISIEEKTDSKGEKYNYVTRTTYRKAMKDLGVDLNDVKTKAELRKQQKNVGNQQP